MSDPLNPSPSTIPMVIPATAEATSEYRLAQSQASLEREGQLKDIGRGFKRGQALDPANCIISSPIDGWSPPTPVTIASHVPPPMAAKVNNLFSPQGLAAFIATSDSTAGVTESIAYDENEAIILPLVEPMGPATIAPTIAEGEGEGGDPGDENDQ